MAAVGEGRFGEVLSFQRNESSGMKAKEWKPPKEVCGMLTSQSLKQREEDAPPIMFGK